MAEVHYLISDTAKKVDVESHVLRYWEDELELPIPRNEMGHRYYTDYHIRLFRQIKELKEKGYQLKAIKNALNKMAGAMDDIVITEDYMEEDMKAAWKESQVNEGKAAGYEKKSAGTKEAEQNTERTAGQKAGQGVKAEKGQKEEKEDGKPAEDERDKPGREETALKEAEPVRPAQATGLSPEKMAQFQTIMNHIIGQAMEANLEKISWKITEEVSDTVSENVSDKVMKEVEYLLRVSDEKEEERFKQLDETIRAYQKNGRSRKEAAATRMPFFKKKRFGKSGKKLF